MTYQSSMFLNLKMIINYLISGICRVRSQTISYPHTFMTFAMTYLYLPTIYYLYIFQVNVNCTGQVLIKHTFK